MSGILTALVGTVSSSEFSVLANDVTRAQFGRSSSGLVTTTQLPNTTPIGGTSPFTYNWAYVSGSMIVEPTFTGIANPTWSAIVNELAPEIAVWRVTVTDATNATAVKEITITLIWNEVL
jgi:hypothetical protein